MFFDMRRLGQRERDVDVRVVFLKLGRRGGHVAPAETEGRIDTQRADLMVAARLAPPSAHRTGPVCRRRARTAARLLRSAANVAPNGRSNGCPVFFRSAASAALPPTASIPAAAPPRAGCRIP